MTEDMVEIETAEVVTEATTEVEEVVVDILVVDTEVITVVTVVTKEIMKENLIQTTKPPNKLKRNTV